VKVQLRFVPTSRPGVGGQRDAGAMGSSPRQTARRDFLRAAGLSLAGAVALPGRFAAGAPDIGRRAGPDPGASGRLRGIMVDAARLPEPLSYYRRLIDFGCEWGLNALVLRLTDDQGSALRFRGHPELLTHRHALKPDEARELAAYGEQQGVMVIPEIEFVRPHPLHHVSPPPRSSGRPS
jgi:Glycosyl hydrolase family 20, catalytic domain